MTDAKATIIAAVITGVLGIVGAAIALVPQIITLQRENSALTEQKDNLQEQNEVLQAEARTDVSALEKRIADLEAKNRTLSDEISQIKTNYETVQSNYEAALAEIDEKDATIDRLNKELTDLLKTPDPNNNPVEATNGEQDINLIEACPPYETFGYETPNTISMMGVTYTNGFTLSLAGSAIFNLKNEYKELEFDFGHLDGSGTHTGSFVIYLDGKYTQTIEANSEMVVTHIVIPLNNALQMKIQGVHNYSVGSAYMKYGFVNVVIK